MNRFSIASIAAAAAFFTALPASAALGVGEGSPGYPHESMTAVSTLDRATVRAEAAQAVAAGRVVQGEIGLALADRTGGALERAQVRAEAATAVRLGLVRGGEATVVYTAPQLDAIRVAGERAVSTVVAAQR